MAEATHLTIDELEGATSDLLDKRGAALARLSAAPVYRPLLEKKRAELAALPPALRGLPRAEQLRLLDRDHDRRLRAIHFLRLALDEWPDSTEAMKAASTALVTDFVAGAGQTQLPYGVEAEAAAEREPKIAVHAATLAAVPTPDGKTVKVWVESYVAAGKALGASHSGRADDLSGRGDASKAGALRSGLLGIFADLRTAIRRELEVNAALPRTLEDDILGYLDELERLGIARANPQKTPPPGGATPA